MDDGDDDTDDDTDDTDDDHDDDDTDDDNDHKNNSYTAAGAAPTFCFVTIRENWKNCFFGLPGPKWKIEFFMTFYIWQVFPVYTLISELPAL